MHVKNLSTDIIPIDIQLWQLFAATIKTQEYLKIGKRKVSTIYFIIMHISHDLEWRLKRYKIFSLLHRHQQ